METGTFVVGRYDERPLRRDLLGAEDLTPEGEGHECLFLHP